MDHHCPWTQNCVSHTTFPHFLRFVLYTVLSMSILAYHLSTRVYIIWETRNLPAYLGPPTWTIAHLVVLTATNSLTLFALSLLFLRALYSFATNATMIEDWEIERHESLVLRSKKTGGFVYANGGQRMRVERQEFPDDVGFWRNMCQGMGSSFPPLWVLPFAGGPTVESASGWEENGFEEAGKVWPPPDPDKMPREQRNLEEEVGEVQYRSGRDDVDAFRERQQRDFQRWENVGEEGSGSESVESGVDENERDGWMNADGERLEDYGVDEDPEDDIPLGELLRRRKARAFQE